MRDYLTYGESGMEDLRTAVNARRRKPVISAFCNELQRILRDEAPVPTDVINREFRRRAKEEAEGGEQEDPLVYDDQQAYEALADLWEYLGLNADGEPEGVIGEVKSTTRNARSQLLWIDGDPVEALRTWMSWRALALFIGGAVLSTASWAGYQRIDIGFIRGLLLLLTIAGFVGASIGGGALWLRRVRYVNPDAFLPKEPKPKEERR
ncbi:hypothetical protein [Streptomyces sp. Isolate_45]|uniref:hypothetical protein n=1 Tax=Streptomyces sp. Isolate_45 TaxID=2950111 RepID=UPI002481FFF3|nr:hypothetical protein [Streptomyces sp. Isolate_45]MDA5282530.1 hypothetical protein [Streptomyces sp. Isolate_45]